MLKSEILSKVPKSDRLEKAGWRTLVFSGRHRRDGLGVFNTGNKSYVAVFSRDPLTEGEVKLPIGELVSVWDKRHLPKEKVRLKSNEFFVMHSDSDAYFVAKLLE